MQITTERLILREYVETDWPAVLEYQRDPRYLRFNPWEERTAEQVRTFVQVFIDAQGEQPRKRFAFAVTLKASGQLIGNSNLRKNRPEDRVGEIGYEIAPLHWGNGYATEAAEAIIKFGFGELKLHRIAAWCIAENTASSHVLEKLGMRMEGRLREQEWLKGRWWDALLYAILDREYLERSRNPSALSRDP
ncbi:MAG TPA: GNAT family protein [Anaerolineae bacterium]